MKYLVFFITLNCFAGFLPSSFQTHFVQKVMSEISGKIKESEGDLDYQYPGQIKFSVKKGGNSLFVSNKKKSWYYTPPFIEGEKGNVVIQNSSSLFLSKFFDSLKRGLIDNSFYSVSAGKGKVEIIFKQDIAGRIGVKKATFPSNRKVNEIKSLRELKTMILTRLDDKEITLEFSTFKEDISFQKDHFVFVLPKGTIVSEK